MPPGTPSDYGIHDRLIARWKGLGTEMTDEQIASIIGYLTGGVLTRLTPKFTRMLLSSEGVQDAGRINLATVSEAINDEIFRARLDALQSTTDCEVPRLPGLGLELGYLPTGESRCPHFPILLGEEDESWRASTMTNREVCIIHAVEKLTNEKEWWSLCADANVCERWKQEMLAMDWPAVVDLRFADFTAEMADAVIRELRAKADFYQETRLIPVMDFSAAAVKSDNILTDELAHALRLAIVSLERDREAEENSIVEGNHNTLDLIDPSLWPLMYGKSRFVPETSIGIEDALGHSGTGVTIVRPLQLERASVNHSVDFQWLPCNVSLSPDGEARIESYINNLHPVRDAALYPIIQNLIQKSLPAWDMVYRWPLESRPIRIETTEAVWNCKTEDVCEPHGGCFPTNRPLEPGEDDREEHPDEIDPYTAQIIATPRAQKDQEWMTRTHMPIIPDPELQTTWLDLNSTEAESSSGLLESASKIQVIVKLTTIKLTPESPSFEGGSWKMDGLFNEHICATAVYFFDSDNITDASLTFRTRGNEQCLRWELFYLREELEAIDRVFSTTNNQRTTQNVGTVATPQGRAVFYPNVYQHRAGPFGLADPTRPGHCKVLKLHLVDPKIPVISTANVAPQQRHWWEEEARLGSDVLPRLPAELQSMVLEEADVLMDLAGAKKVRSRLLEERRSRNESVNAGVECESFGFGR